MTAWQSHGNSQIAFLDMNLFPTSHLFFGFSANLVLLQNHTHPANKRFLGHKNTLQYSYYTATATTTKTAATATTTTTTTFSIH